jgi:phosphoribosylaminoimidazole-succinocarboxamide synthase
MMTTTYRGSVKDVLTGGVDAKGKPVAVFAYSDAYSVFDWGKMPDLLAKKGEALTLIAAEIFERVGRAETWQEFSRSAGAQRLRRGNRFGAAFNELGELLQKEGLRTHYLGVVDSSSLQASGEVIRPQHLSDLHAPVDQMVVSEVKVACPVVSQVMGRQVPDYFPCREAEAPRLIPLEVVFRFSCPQGSSLRSRVSANPSLLAELGFGGYELGPEEAPTVFDFPVLELFTKLESTDRSVGLSEGLAISGLNASQLQELMLSTAWIAGWLRARFEKLGIELADGKLEWGLWPNGRLALVDAIGPDELRLLGGSPSGSSSGEVGRKTQLSKEALRSYYRTTEWYRHLQKAKAEASLRGQSDWKRGIPEAPPLPQEFKEIMTHLYQALANQLCERKFFPSAWELSEVIKRVSGFLDPIVQKQVSTHVEERGAMP